MKNRIKLFTFSLLLLACNGNNTKHLEIVVEDSVIIKRESTYKTVLWLKNKRSSIVKITDYRLSCECTMLDSLSLPFYISAKTEKSIPVIIKADSSNRDILKIITVTFKTTEEPFFVSKNIKVIIK